MNTRMMVGINVAKSNVANFQLVRRSLGVGELGIGIGNRRRAMRFGGQAGNIFTLATFSKLLCVVGLLMLCGCTLERYDYEMSREPYERPSVVTDDFREDNHVQPCFIVTTMCWEKFAHPGDQYMGPIGLFVLLGHFLGDTSFSLCADIVTMPWQIARYMRFTSDDSDASRSAMVPELLRYLNIGENYLNVGENQHRLVNTALTVLALLHHGDLPGCETEFSEMCEKGIEHLVSCADTSGTKIRFKGEDADPRALFIASDALVSAYGYTRNPNLREIAEKCAARVSEEVASVGVDAVIDEKTAGKLRWAVMTLQDAKGAGLSVADLYACLERARALLSRYGKGDNGYYDVWELWRKVFVDGTADAGAWATLYATRRDAVRKSIYVSGSVQDKDGEWRWRSDVRPCEGGIEESGLGRDADIALAVLQLTWPISNRCPPKNGVTTDTGAGVPVDL